MPKNVVSVVSYEELGSVKRVIQDCDGFGELKRNARVLIKPNLVGWDNLGPYPPFGILTTSAVVEGLCQALIEAGAGKIIIGEGSIQCAVIGSSTLKIYQQLGYHKLVERYGVELVDFNQGGWQEIELLPGHKVKVTDQLSGCDFFINVPVLKTHVGTVVSLGMKNLKGLLRHQSKIYCHHPEISLEDLICQLGDKFPPSLTIIDGIYDNERGPLHFGRARRRNLLIGSTDLYSADLVGAYLLGYGAEEVGYLKNWAEAHQRGKSLSKLIIRTEPDLEKVRRRLEWDWEWSKDNSCPELYTKLGINGIILPKYDQTLCTGCTYIYIPLMVTLMSIERKQFDQYEFLTGKKMAPSGLAKKTFLLGNCQIELNKNHSACQEVVLLKGCPPSLSEIYRVFQEHNIPVCLEIYKQYRRDIMKRYLRRPEFFSFEHFYLDGIPPEEIMLREG